MKSELILNETENFQKPLFSINADKVSNVKNPNQRILKVENKRAAPPVAHYNN